MFRRQFFGLELAFHATRSNQHNFSSQRSSGFALDCGSVAWHDDDSLGLERSGGIGDPLGMIATGIRDYAARAFVVSEGRDFVVSPTELEGSDRLKVFRFEIERAPIVLERNQRCADSDAVQAAAGFQDVRE